MMTKAGVHVTVVACATLLWAGTALATFTPSGQQKCDSARITAWKAYVSCVDGVVAKDASCSPTCGSPGVATYAEFAKCRHTYFKKWTAFQTKSSVVGSTCQGGSRFVDNGDGTVLDYLTGLVWEQKTLAPPAGPPSVHNVDNVYTWSADQGLTWNPNDEGGTAFTNFLTGGLNTPGFAGASGWRLPTLVELQTIVQDFACQGPVISSTCTCADSCIDATFGPVSTIGYWSTTRDVSIPVAVWGVSFGGGAGGGVGVNNVSGAGSVRAVRGGL